MDAGSDGPWIRIDGVADLADGEVRAVTARGHKLVVVRVGDERVACADRCLHYGVRLSGGRLDGTVLECRWHHWRYDMLAGSYTAGPDGVADELPAPFTTYPVVVDADGLRVSKRARPSAAGSAAEPRVGGRQMSDPT